MCPPVADASAQYAIPVEKSRPKIKQVWSRNKIFVADVNFDAKITKISRVEWQGNMGRSSPVWSMEGAYPAAWLSDDGDHFVAGYDGGELLRPDYAKDQAMLSFFKRNSLIRQLRLNELIGDFSKLEKAGVNYRWIRYSELNACGHLAVETVEGRETLFDVTTGEAAKLQPAAPRMAGWKRHRDLLGCYEFEYPSDYALQQDRDYQGKPMGWISLKGEKDQKPVIEASVEDAADYPREYAGRTLAEFVFDRAAGMHSADGPNGSTYATGIAQQRRFTNPGNLDVMEFYLSVVEETFPDAHQRTRTRRTAGPIYAVSITAPGDPHRVLYLRFIDDGGTSSRGQNILRQIADSVRRGLSAP